MANGGRVYAELCFMVFWEKPFNLLAILVNRMYVLLNTLVTLSIMCSGPSMEPEIQNSGSIVFAENLS